MTGWTREAAELAALLVVYFALALAWVAVAAWAWAHPELRRPLGPGERVGEPDGDGDHHGEWPDAGEEVWFDDEARARD